MTALSLSQEVHSVSWMESLLAEISTPKWVSNVDRKFEDTAFTRKGLDKKDEVSLLQNGSLALRSRVQLCSQNTHHV